MDKKLTSVKDIANELSGVGEGLREKEEEREEMEMGRNGMG